MASIFALGSVLTVDLTTGRSALAPFPEAVEGRFLAGRGFAVHRLRQEVPPGTDPLGPGNVIIFSCGLLAGTPAPGSSRLHLCALSPLTGLLGSSNIGGAAADRLRSCGVQALAVTGRAPVPSVLVVDGQGVDIVEAGPLWGADTWEAEDGLKKRFSGGRTAVLAIGPAGENRVPMACIVSERDHAAGRTGLGAVMGAKNLKAVVFRGAGEKRPAGSKSQRRAVAEYAEQVRKAPDFDFFSRHGGAGYTVWCSNSGFAGAYNYRQPRFAHVEKIDGRRLAADRTRSRGCPRCPVRCKAELRRAGRPAFRPEFESMINLGIKCGLADLDALVRLDNLCTRLGLDVISTATTVSFAMELNERGMLPVELSGGDAPCWGEPVAMERLIRQISASQGLGAVLGQGVRRAADRLGGAAMDLAPHVKGLELCGYHPGYMMGAALGYAVSSRGGDFNNIYAAMEYSWPPARGEAVFGTAASVDCRSTEGKGALIRRAAILSCALDALGLCKVPALSLVGHFDLENEARLAGELAGKKTAAEDLLAAGERIVHLERLFNLDHGLDPIRDDRLPESFFSGLPEGSKDQVLTREGFEGMRDDFYGAMGWDRRGRPKVETLCRLEIPLPARRAPDDEEPMATPGNISGPAGRGAAPASALAAESDGENRNRRWKR